MVGANEEKGGPESANRGPGIRDQPCRHCPDNVTGTPPPRAIGQTRKRSRHRDDGG